MNREELALNSEVIGHIKAEAVPLVKELMEADLERIILYGSCARGDFTEDSDIDIALMTNCSRLEAKKYGDGLAKIATELAMKYFAVVNFACFPCTEFSEKKSWYPYFYNIDREGEVLYG